MAGPLVTALALRAPAPLLRRMPQHLWVDALATVLFLVLAFFEYSWGPHADDGQRYGPIGLSPLYSALGILPVAVRRVAPVTALSLSTAAVVVPSLFGPIWVLFWSGSMVLLLLLYTVARHRPWRIACGACLLPVLAVLVPYGAPGADPHPENPPIAVLVFLLTFELFAVPFGIALRRTATQEARLADALAVLEREQADRDLAAVQEVRRALARDLHDVVAHAVSLMLLQAGAARLAVSDDPAGAHRSLDAVLRTGAEASSDLAALLTVLRATDDRPVDTDGLAELPALVAEARRAGLEVLVRRSEPAPVLPAGLDQAAYRIVQEALTNVVKHAGPTRVVVDVRSGDLLRIAVVDDGPRRRLHLPAGSGLGLVGMRERAQLFGGTLEAGPTATGGWGVEVRLPLPEAE